MKWTRKQPTRDGRYWCAIRWSKKDKFYLVKLCDVFGHETARKDKQWDGPYASGFWGGSLPLRMLRDIDLWWATEPLPVPEPPPFKRSKRKVLE